MATSVFRRLQSLPAIVIVVLTEATRRRAEGSITSAVFEEQISRIIDEELAPRKLYLLVRELPGGRLRFIVKECDTGTVCDLLNFSADGTLEPDSAGIFHEAAQTTAH